MAVVCLWVMQVRNTSCFCACSSSHISDHRSCASGVISKPLTKNQIQCIMHIIINRIALIMCDPPRARRLKLTATLLIGAINVTVFIIWIPARLQISEHWILVNDIWDRIEKGIFAICDLGLNLYFIYLVKTELTVHGLTKYRYLYLFNLGMIFISISLDVGRNPGP